MSERDDVQKLRELIEAEVLKHEHKTKIPPDDIANAVLKALDGGQLTLAASLELRQLAREVLRHRYETAADREKKREKREPLFPGLPKIQRRYPAADGSGYLKTEDMTLKDRVFNINQLRSRGGALTKHADELDILTMRDFPEYRGERDEAAS